VPLQAAEKGLKLNGGDSCRSAAHGATRWQATSGIPAIRRTGHWAARKGPASMFNGMISPIAPYAIKGVA
jgi:hypothetical protein